jgi:putative oxidoreductase
MYYYISSPIITIIGRVIFGLYFAYSGIGHFKNASMLTGYAASKKVPMPKLAIYASGTLLLLGGLGIIFHVFWTLSVLFIIIFLVPTTLFMHDFWKEKDPAARSSSKVAFLKNTALFAAALMIF